MGKVRVPIAGAHNKVAQIETRATVGATLGRDLRLPDGSVPTLAQLAQLFGAPAAEAAPRQRIVTWDTLADRPANLLQAASLASAGFVVRQPDGSWVTIEQLQISDIVGLVAELSAKAPAIPGLLRAEPALDDQILWWDVESQAYRRARFRDLPLQLRANTYSTLVRTGVRAPRASVSGSNVVNVSARSVRVRALQASVEQQAPIEIMVSPQRVGVRVLRTARPWTPAELTTSVWLDADDEETIDLDGNDNIQQWDDQSGNDDHRTQSFSGRRPALIAEALAGRAVARFDGSDDVLLNNSEASRNVFRATGFGWQMAVYRKRGTDGSNNGRAIGCYSNGSNGFTRFALAAGWTAAPNLNVPLAIVRRLDGDSALFITSGSPRVDEWTMLLAAVDWSSGVIRLYVDGEMVEEDDSSLSSGSTSDTTGARASTVGGYVAGTGGTPSTDNPADIDLAGYLAGAEPLSGAEIDQLFGWAAHRWGLTDNLDAEHPYKSAPPLAA